jgi:hypothetical protein
MYKKFSVVLGVSVSFDRTVVVRAKDAESARKLASKQYGAEYGNLGGWEAVGLDSATLVVDCQEATNARLIATAPDLLAALIREDEARALEVKAKLDNSWKFSANAARNEADKMRRAAISKAEAR